MLLAFRRPRVRHCNRAHRLDSTSPESHTPMPSGVKARTCQSSAHPRRSTATSVRPSPLLLSMLENIRPDLRQLTDTICAQLTTADSTAAPCDNELVPSLLLRRCDNHGQIILAAACRFWAHTRVKTVGIDSFFVGADTSQSPCLEAAHETNQDSRCA